MASPVDISVFYVWLPYPTDIFHACAEKGSQPRWGIGKSDESSKFSFIRILKPPPQHDSLHLEDRSRSEIPTSFQQCFWSFSACRVRDIEAMINFLIGNVLQITSYGINEKSSVYMLPTAEFKSHILSGLSEHSTEHVQYVAYMLSFIGYKHAE